MVEAMNGGGGAGLFGPVGLERVTPGMVIDVASLILQGFHAVPVKLKMLLDRLFSLLSPEEITAVLRGFGWTIQDYQRGYILKVCIVFSTGLDDKYLMFCIFSIPELSGSQPGQVENVYSRGRASHPPAVPQIQRDEAAHPAAHPTGALREERGHQAEAAGAHDEADEQQQH